MLGVSSVPGHGPGAPKRGHQIQAGSLLQATLTVPTMPGAFSVPCPVFL